MRKPLESSVTEIDILFYSVQNCSQILLLTIVFLMQTLTNI